MQAQNQMNDKELARSLYQKVYLIRRAEEAIRVNYASDKMKTPMHMSMGAEAIAAGVCQALRTEDQILGTYRSHGVYLAKTGETDAFFAEMYGKASGMAKGKGGSMHLTAPDHGLICTSAIVGTTIPVAVGAAYANKMQKNGKVVAVFFGDGAVDEGVFWESLNSACVMKLPVLFVYEDNGLAVHVPAGQRHGYKSIVDVVKQFDCNVFSSESTDPGAVYNLALQAIGTMNSTQQPSFLRLAYYRYLEHVGTNEDFNAGYRDRAEYEKWRRSDPVALQRKTLGRWLSEAEVTAIERAIDEQVEASVKRADEAPFSRPQALYEDIVA
jgi:TPP-dependent pyruvate/acetoin dehydrogenase alpha subunit